MNDNKQIREAIDLIKYHLACNAHARESNIRTVVEAWLAEHPDDDDEPVTVEWLRSLKNIGYSPDEYSVGTISLLQTGSGWAVYVNEQFGIRLGDVSTRGDVRRLARALRVELGDGQ